MCFGVFIHRFYLWESANTEKKPNSDTLVWRQLPDGAIGPLKIIIFLWISGFVFSVFMLFLGN